MNYHEALASGSSPEDFRIELSNVRCVRLYGRSSKIKRQSSGCIFGI